MTTLYILIGVMTLILECGKTDTNSIFTKLAHGTLFVGCILAYFLNVQHVFLLGVILTIGVEIIKGYRPRNTRSSDVKEATE